jgi:hypothetical protein
MHELASLFSALHRVEALLDAMECFLHPVVAVPGLRTPLVDQPVDSVR